VSPGTLFAVLIWGLALLVASRPAAATARADPARWTQSAFATAQADPARGTQSAVATGQAGREGGTGPRRGGNPEAAKIANPVPATPESVAAGKRAYGQLCANCHGPSGKGDGSTTGADQPSDLTDAVWDFGSTDGEIFSVIRDGLPGKDMGGYAERLKEADLWNVVNFIRSLARK
jgi:mono/diheme cytochrome c family protein